MFAFFRLLMAMPIGAFALNGTENSVVYRQVLLNEKRVAVLHWFVVFLTVNNDGHTVRVPTCTVCSVLSRL